MKTLKALWARWEKIAQIIATFQARILLSIVYCLLFPIGFLFTFILDPLHIKSKRNTNWTQKVNPSHSLLAHQKQY